MKHLAVTIPTILLFLATQPALAETEDEDDWLVEYEAPPLECDQGLAAWGEINAIDEEWIAGEDGCPPPHEADQGIAAWGETDDIDLEWTEYESDRGAAAVALAQALDLSWEIREEDDPFTHDPDQGIAAWSDEGTIEVEWPEYEPDHGMGAWGDKETIDVEWELE